MPKLSGLFDSFDNLDQIAVEDVIRWIKPVPQTIQLENYIATKILYPHTIPMSEYDMKVDLAILREALRLNGPRIDLKKTNALLGENSFLNVTLRKIIIPEKFLYFTPDLVSLTWAFVDGLLLDRHKEDWFQDYWSVVISGDSEEVVGTILLPQFQNKGGVMEVNVSGKNYKIRAGSLIIIPCSQTHCELIYKFNQGKILGKQESAIEVYGGRLGLMIDGRKI